MQENERKLQQAEGGNEQTSDNLKAHLEESPGSEPNESQDAMPENTEEPKSESIPSEAEDTEKESKPSGQSNDAIDEIDESNAEDAEDAENEKRHYIPMLDYNPSHLENWWGDLQRLVKKKRIRAIAELVGPIKNKYVKKFQK